MTRAFVLPISLAVLLLPAGASAASFGSGAEVARSASTGKVRFVAPARPQPTSGTREEAGRAFLRRHAADFGLRGASTLRRAGKERVPGGITAVRYQQVLSGVPVMGGEFVVRFDRAGALLSVSGEAEPAPAVDTDPALSAADARQRAIARVARAEDVSAVRLLAGLPELRVWDARIMGGAGPQRPQLAWTVEVAGRGLALRKLEVIDAHRGATLASIDEIHAARDRRVCDAGNNRLNAAAPVYPCTAPVLTEGGNAEAAQADVRQAYEFSGATYDFFATRFGRDSLDGAGMPLRSTVRFCEQDLSVECPYDNAFWDGQQMVYGQGFAAADDVVGHELAHGVTDFSSRLFYYAQSGAINESLSDVFGEFIDLVTPSPGDDAADRWKLGESLPASIGVIRDMENPAAEPFTDPDSMVSPHYVDSDPTDNDGVHTNSGVGNKAAFLLTDGGSFRGQTVTGIGLDKAARLYYAVQTGYLTSASDYADLGTALGAACDELVGTASFAAEDCTGVRRAVTATAMLTERPTTVDEPACGSGQAPAYVFYDDLEIPGTTAFERTNAIGNAWFYPQNPNPYEGFDATYATSGTTNLWGDDPDAQTDSAFGMAQGVTVPAGGFLRFRHAYSFESSGAGEFFDGGVVEVSENGGPFVDLPAASDYPGRIVTGQGNPLAGRDAFVGSSHGYTTTVLPLTDQVGDNIRIRFRIGTDGSLGDWGWFIDDIGIGACGTDADPPDTAITGGPADGGSTSSTRPEFTAASTEPGSTFRCRVDGTPVSPCASRTVVGPLALGAHTFEVRAVDPSGKVDATPATRSFTVGRDDGGGGPNPTPTPTPTATPTPTPPPPLTPRPRVTKTRVTAKRVTLTVDVRAPGRLTVSGRGAGVRLRARPLRVSSARRVAVRVRIPAKLRKRARRRAVTVAFTITLRPAAEGGRPATTLKRVRLKRR